MFTGGAKQKDDDGFDADAAIATGEIGKLIPDLLEALGGEVELGADMPATPATLVTPQPSAVPAAQADEDDAPFLTRRRVFRPGLLRSLSS